MLLSEQMLIVEFFLCTCFRAQFHNLSNDRKNNLEIVHHMAMIKNQVGISFTLFFVVDTFFVFLLLLLILFSFLTML